MSVLSCGIWASLDVTHGLQSTWDQQLWYAGSLVKACELSYPVAYRISLTKAWACDPCLGRRVLYHWLDHLGSPSSRFVVVQSLSHVWLFATPWTQQTRLPCPSSSQVCSTSSPLSRWCHPTISSSVFPFSSCLQSFQVSGSFPMSQLFSSGGQSSGVSASATALSMNIQGWFPLGLTGWISLKSRGLSRVFSNTTVWKHHFFGTQSSSRSNSDIPMWLLGKTLTRRTFVGKVTSLLFNTLSRFVVAFLARRKHLLISILISTSRLIWIIFCDHNYNISSTCQGLLSVFCALLYLQWSQL